jgi:hypothetical protein
MTPQVAIIWEIFSRGESPKVNRTTIQVFAVVRLDKYFETEEDRIAVQAVLPTIDEARAEVARLNSLCDPSSSLYFFRATRYYPEGRSARPGPNDKS